MASASSNCVPVVRSTRSSARKGVGSARSELCTQRSGRSSAPSGRSAAVETRRRSRSRRRSRADSVEGSAGAIRSPVVRDGEINSLIVRPGECGRLRCRRTLATWLSSTPQHPQSPRRPRPPAGASPRHGTPRPAVGRGPRPQGGRGRRRCRSHGAGRRRRSRGGVVVDADGNSLIDLGSGIAVTTVGNAHPKVAAAVAAQAAQFTHTCFMISPYESYVGVAEALNRVTPATSPRRAPCSTPAPRLSRTRSRSPASTPVVRPSSRSTTATTAARTSPWR